MRAVFFFPFAAACISPCIRHAVRALQHLGHPLETTQDEVLEVQSNLGLGFT